MVDRHTGKSGRIKGIGILRSMPIFWLSQTLSASNIYNTECPDLGVHKQQPPHSGLQVQKTYDFDGANAV